MRPETNGPRETTLHVIDTPPPLVTVMVVPMGAALLAHVPAGMVFSQLATPARALEDEPRGTETGVGASTGARGTSVMANVGGPAAGTVVGGTVVGGTVVGGTVGGDTARNPAGAVGAALPALPAPAGDPSPTPTAARPAANASDWASARPGATADIPTSDNAHAATIGEPGNADWSTR